MTMMFVCFKQNTKQNTKKLWMIFKMEKRADFKVRIRMHERSYLRFN